MPTNEIRMKTVVIGTYMKSDGTGSFILYGLGDDGIVYRRDDRVKGWVAMSMNVEEAFGTAAID